MPENPQKIKLRRDPVEDSDLVENSSTPTDENICFLEQDFEEITSKVENKVSKRLRDTEHCQRERLKLNENLSAKVYNLGERNKTYGIRPKPKTGIRPKVKIIFQE